MRLRPVVCSCVVLLLAFAFLGCSSYRHDLREARAAGGGGPNTLPRIWSGRWQDAKRPQHGGRMDLVLTPVGETLYRASARSHWWKVFRSDYDVNLVLTPVAPGEWLVLGDKEIRFFGGHTMQGRVSTQRFAADYRVGKFGGSIDLTPGEVAAGARKSPATGR